ncbi:hypothetical protein [Arthrobacter cryoconiti]|uniref:DsrE/DsrF-like family protein n=1 Tax=Arthrobacter cryoconiti TaxID=748907 RepID=A0ABV8QYZ4_9MICC|nr:hypothetical protein [Arthrobacter cryoconiti]MCC9067541.1 hypothetical protein [Arthrobacter cryoconiti]
MTENGHSSPGLVLHAYGPDAQHLLGSFRSALNAVAALPHAAIEIVVQGPVVAQLCEEEFAESVSNALAAGIAINACANSLRSAGVDAGALLPGVGQVPSAVAHLAQRQWDGWSYIRL